MICTCGNKYEPPKHLGKSLASLCPICRRNRRREIYGRTKQSAVLSVEGKEGLYNLRTIKDMIALELLPNGLVLCDTHYKRHYRIENRKIVRTDKVNSRQRGELTRDEKHVAFYEVLKAKPSGWRKGEAHEYWYGKGKIYGTMDKVLNALDGMNLLTWEDEKNIYAFSNDTLNFHA